MSDLTNKVNQALEGQEELTRMEALNPYRIRDYCHYDGSATIWEREDLPDAIVKGKIVYACIECASERRYNPMEDKRT